MAKDDGSKRCGPQNDGDHGRRATENRDGGRESYSGLELVHYGSFTELTRNFGMGPPLDPVDPFTGTLPP